MQKSKYGQWELIVHTKIIYKYCLLLCCESFNTFFRLFLYISPIILIRIVLSVEIFSQLEQSTKIKEGHIFGENLF